ncbi:MAG: VanZ family protein [Clostridia bacterium]|nr:VanZ family protein [Clostridia bacterium]
MKRKVLYALTAIVLLIIWVHSMLPPDLSGEESGWVADSFINPIWNAIFHTDLNMTVVRKLAHITEFAVLAVLLTCDFRGSAVKTFGTGFAAAFLDETIQIFSGRGPMISDVWIDLLGAAIGFVLCRCIAGKRFQKEMTRLDAERTT